MAYSNRNQQIVELFPKLPNYRLAQIEEALFSPEIRSWLDVSTLPKAMREKLDKDMPFMSVTVDEIVASIDGDTHKAAIIVEGGQKIETVLMKNKRGMFTICVSSQVGCAMRCGFCATGKMGLIRNLEAEEIIDQLRLWQQYLVDNMGEDDRISNIVYMGMGEPLANYENVKSSLNTILKHTDIGTTRITVSTVGVLPRLEQVLADEDWPHVRMAVSLHSADKATRKEIVPTSYDDFLPKLADWSRRYLERFGNRRHHLTFEYVMLKDINDTKHHATLLANFVNRIGTVRVNLIPYNFTDCGFAASTVDTITAFRETLDKKGVVVTTRRTQGEDIAAACGQLVKKNEK